MEILDIVDENGNPTGKTAKRGYIHEKGLLHRTSHLWIYRIKDGRPQILLQRRSKNKDSFPGCYDISSAGHIPAGDDYVVSALRELSEELGVRACEKDLIFCGLRPVSYDMVFHGKPFHARQISGVYLLELNLDEDAFTLQESELDLVSWFDWDTCIKAVRENSIPHCIMESELKMLAKGNPLLAFPEE
ncbi:MAG: NUDIX domain-containing protein [Oscillospiraceae bacterium]|nr:NUDIX domain-containing protein [Oscillospiraceae bacterium]